MAQEGALKIMETVGVPVQGYSMADFALVFRLSWQHLLGKFPTHSRRLFVSWNTKVLSWFQ